MSVILCRSIAVCIAGCALAAGAASPATGPTTRAHAMFVPERMDDFAWENDKVAFRVYGPALQKKDGPQSGIDIWMKRTPALVQTAWYADGRYHDDRGEGLDGYAVGASRGCGGTAVVRGDRTFTGANFIAWKIVENGPDRCVFTLDYAPIDCGGVSVAEHKTITLDAGSQFNRIESTWTFDAPKNGPPIEVAVGLKIHPKGTILARDEANSRFLAEWEPTDGKDNGHTGVAVIVPGTKSMRVIEQDGNLLAILPVTSGEPLVYFAGGGWSKNGFADSDAWLAHARETAARPAP